MMYERKVRHLCAAELKISLQFNKLFSSLQHIPSNKILSAPAAKKKKAPFHSWLTRICGILFNANEEAVARAFFEDNERDGIQCVEFNWEKKREKERKEIVMRKNLSQDILIPCKCMPIVFTLSLLPIVSASACACSSHFITALLEMTMQMYL